MVPVVTMVVQIVKSEVAVEENRSTIVAVKSINDIIALDHHPVALLLMMIKSADISAK